LQNSRRFCIRKLNSSGQEVKKDIRDDIVEETKIKFDGSGNIFIKGAKITLTSSNTINATFGFLKYDNTLSHLSSKIFDNMDAFAVDHSGNIYRSQISGSNYYLIKENSVEELWRKNIHNSSGIGEIIVDETGDIYVTSWKLHQDNNNISDIDILKFDASGNQRMDIPMNNYLTGIVLMTIDLCGNIYVTAAKLNDNELDLYTQKFYSNGNLCGSPMVYHNTDFLNHYIQLKDILLDINGNVYVSGSEWNSDHLGLILHEFLTLKYQQ
jgi:outer membrane protein assembly factor BamB